MEQTIRLISITPSADETEIQWEDTTSFNGTYVLHYSDNGKDWRSMPVSPGTTYIDYLDSQTSYQAYIQASDGRTGGILHFRTE